MGLQGLSFPAWEFGGPSLQISGTPSPGLPATQPLPSEHLGVRSLLPCTGGL